MKYILLDLFKLLYGYINLNEVFYLYFIMCIYVLVFKGDDDLEIEFLREEGLY